MRVGGVPTNAQVDYVTLHLLEGEARRTVIFFLNCWPLPPEDVTSHSQLEHWSALHRLSYTELRNRQSVWWPGMLLYSDH